jgi:hypothetical protein
MGAGERRKTFFHEKKKFFSSPRTPLLFSKKAGYFMKQGQYPVSDFLLI